MSGGVYGLILILSFGIPGLGASAFLWAPLTAPPVNGLGTQSFPVTIPALVPTRCCRGMKSRCPRAPRCRRPPVPPRLCAPLASPRQDGCAGSEARLRFPPEGAPAAEGNEEQRRGCSALPSEQGALWGLRVWKVRR